jgi:hypothetical protein
LEHPHRSALENHVHRTPRLGNHGLLNVRIGIRSTNEFIYGSRESLLKGHHLVSMLRVLGPAGKIGGIYGRNSLAIRGLTAK